jgi:hypothetical protein
MIQVNVTPMEPMTYGVEIEEGDVRTGHRVHVPDGFWDELGLLEVDEVRAVRESVLFLLDREPGVAIPEELSLATVARQHDDFDDEIRQRILAA